MQWFYLRARDLNGTALTKKEREFLAAPPQLEFVVKTKRRKKIKKRKRVQTSLSDSEVRELRELYGTGDWSFEQLGRKFGKSTATAWNVVHRKGCYAKVR
jgi:hypothetical protein